MKILLINKYHYLKGGADTVFFNTQRLLEQNGHIVIPFCTSREKNAPSEYSRYFVDSPEIRTLGGWDKLKSIKRFFWNSDAAKEIERLIVDEKPDVAHLHNIFNGISLSILPILKKYDIPVVWTIHDTRLICPSSYFNLRGNLCQKCLRFGGLSCGLKGCYQDNFVNSWMCAFEMLHKEKLFQYDRYVSKYIFVSNRYKDLHSQRHCYFSNKGIVLYNFYPELHEVKTNTQNGRYIFYYGRITREKGIKTLVEVMKDLPDVDLKVAGTGPMLEELQSSRLPNVDFLGFQSGKELFDLVQNASFVIVPSGWEENNPMTIIEAYSYGKPVIGSRIGGITEIIEEGRTGFCFDAFSKQSLLATIRKAMALSDNEYEEMSIGARAFAEEHFNPTTHYKELLKIYKSVIK